MHCASKHGRHRQLSACIDFMHHWHGQAWPGQASAVRLDVMQQDPPFDAIMTAVQMAVDSSRAFFCCASRRSAAAASWAASMRRSRSTAAAAARTVSKLSALTPLQLLAEASLAAG